jgi:hypothetical protein
MFGGPAAWMTVDPALRAVMGTIAVALFAAMVTDAGTLATAGLSELSVMF